MKTYKVHVYFSFDREYEIQAENEEQAHDRAVKLCSADVGYSDNYDASDIEEI